MHTFKIHIDIHNTVRMLKESIHQMYPFKV